LLLSYSGSSPRVRRTRTYHYREDVFAGSSPRVRGTRKVDKWLQILAPIDLMIQNGRCPRACRQSRPACWTITDALQLFVLAILRNTAPPPQKGSARGKPAVVRCPATVGLSAPRRGKDTRARSPR
jgi:hypothetical protein